MTPSMHAPEVSPHQQADDSIITFLLDNSCYHPTEWDGLGHSICCPQTHLSEIFIAPSIPLALHTLQGEICCHAALPKSRLPNGACNARCKGQQQASTLMSSALITHAEQLLLSSWYYVVGRLKRNSLRARVLLFNTTLIVGPGKGFLGYELNHHGVQKNSFCLCLGHAQCVSRRRRIQVAKRRYPNTRWRPDQAGNLRRASEDAGLDRAS